MKMAKKKMVGVEIGNHTLKMAVCKDGVPEDFIQVEIPDNMIQNDEILSYNAMGDFIRENLENHKIKCRDAALTLPDRKIFICRVKMPLMTISQLKVNLPYEFRTYITENKEDFVYDYSIIQMKRDENNPHTGEMDVLAAAVDREQLNNYSAMFNRAGLKLEMVTPECLALKNILAQNQDENSEKKDCAIVDLGDNTIKIHFFARGEFDTTRTLEVGCESFVEMASLVSDTDVHIARKNFEMNLDNIQYHDMLIERYENLVVEITRVLNFYRYNHPESDLDCLYICGGGVHIEPLMSRIQSSLDMDVKMVNELLTEKNSFVDNIALCPQVLGILWE